MLYLDNPIGPIHGVMVYTDHESPNDYYYIPERPRLARNEDGPEFIFLKYRRDITDNPALTPDQHQSLGGAFLAFTTDLGIDDDTEQQVKSKLGSGATGEVRLTPVQFRKGTVRLSIAKDAASAPDAPADQPHGISFFEQVYGTTLPSLYGTNRATFALALDGEAATLFEAALKSGICPIGVIYDLEFLGLRPGFDVKVTADYKRVYSSLEMQFGLTASYASIGLKAEIDMAWQKLREDGSIKVEVINFTDDENLRKQANAAFDYFKSELTQTFFSAALQPPSFMQAHPAATSGVTPQLNGVLPGLNTSQQGQLRPNPGAPSTLAPTPAPPPRSPAANVASTILANASMLGPGPVVRPPAPVPTPAPAAGPPPAPPPPPPPPPSSPPSSPPASPPPASPPAPPASPPAAPAPAPPPSAPPAAPSSVPHTAPPSALFAAPATPPPATPPPAAPPAAPHTGAGATTTQTASSGTRPPPAPPGAQTRNVPPGLAGAANNPAASSGFGLQLAFTLKKIEQDELKTREFEFTEQDAVAQTAAPQGLFSTMIHGVDLARYMREISLDDDFFKRINATVSMGSDLTVEGVDSVAVNFEYPANRKPGQQPTDTDGVIFRPGQPTTHTFTCWLNSARSLDFQYQMSVQFLANSEWVGKSNKAVSPWITTRAQAITLDPLSVIGLFDLPISIGVLDPSIQQVQVEVSYEDPANGFSDDRTFVLKAGDPVSHWRLRLSDPTLRSYRYRLTYFFPAGVRYTTDWVSTDSATLVVNSPFHGQLSLRVIPLLDVSNLEEADVEIVYDEPDTGYQQRAQLTFAGPTLNTQTLAIPTLAALPAGYSYSTTIVHADGSVVNPVTTTAGADETALVVKEGPGSTHRITVKLPDTNLAAAGLLALKVLLWGPGAPPDVAEVIFTPSAVADQKVVLVQPNDSGAWSCAFQVTGFTAKGVPRPGATGVFGDPTLLVPLPV